MKLPVLKAFAAGFSYFFLKIGDVIRINWLPLLVMHVATILVMPKYMGPMLAIAEIDPEADPTAVFSAIGPAFGWIALLYLIMAIIYPMLVAGNLRPIIRGDSPSTPFYFQFGGDEFRTLITFILFFVLLVISYVVGVLAFLAVGFALSAISQAIGGIVIALGALAFFVALLWFMLRMSLMFPAAIDKKKIGLAESWRVTKGNSWRLFFYWLLWTLVFAVVVGAYMMVTMPGYFGLLGELVVAADNPAAQQEINRKITEMQLAMWDVSKPGAWVSIAGTYVYMLVYIALWNIAGGIAYRYLAANDAG